MPVILVHNYFPAHPKSFCRKCHINCSDLFEFTLKTLMKPCLFLEMSDLACEELLFHIFMKFIQNSEIMLFPETHPAVQTAPRPRHDRATTAPRPRHDRATCLTVRGQRSFILHSFFFIYSFIFIFLHLLGPGANPRSVRRRNDCLSSRYVRAQSRSGLTTPSDNPLSKLTELNETCPPRPEGDRFLSKLTD